MKNFLIKNIIIMISIVTITINSTIKAEIKSIDSISQAVSDFDYLDGETLVAFDLDDTLINSDSGMFYLLYRKLEDFATTHTDFIKKLRQSFNQLDPEKNMAEYYNIFASAVFSKTEFIPTENITIETIKNLQAKNLKVIGLTASNAGKYGFVENMQIWRDSLLKKIGLDFSSSFNIQEIEFDNLKKVFGFYPVYYKGVLSAARNPKSKVLIEFFNRINWRPKKLIFVDDSHSNCLDVDKEMSDLGIKTTCFWYSAAYKNKININETIIQKQIDHWLKFNEFLSEKEVLANFY